MGKEREKKSFVEYKIKLKLCVIEMEVCENFADIVTYWLY